MSTDFYVNDLVLWDHDKNPGTQKLLFAAIGSSYVRGDKMKSTYTDLNEFGLYKSSDSGVSFSRITDLNNGGGHPEIFTMLMILKYKK